MPSVAAPRPIPNVKARPFLKWVGGKGKLLPQIHRVLPDSFGRYFEPFLGGGALFFELLPKSAVLADANSELIDCYRAVRDSVEDVIDALMQHTYDEGHYYRIRALDPSILALPSRAARTIFLNRSGFNGLYRVNRDGIFNVPFGRYTNPTLCDAENLRACAKALKGIELICGDFATTVSEARSNDLVYFDPPYIPISATSNFTRYSAGAFGPEQHRRLATVFATLAAKDASVVLSNSEAPEVRRLYSAFEIHSVSAPRSVNSDPSKRGNVTEVVVCNRRQRLNRSSRRPAKRV